MTTSDPPSYVHSIRNNLTAFDLVWLVDADVDFSHFRCSEYFVQWANYRPLISQPTIDGRKPESEFSAAAWAKKARLQRSHWVEQQAPLLNTSFLLWYYQQPVIQSVLRLQKKYNVDWGLDFTWCGAAREFAPNANHCMVFNEPVFHNKTATQQWRGLFVRKGYKVLNEAGLRLDFPCWPPTCCVTHPWFYEAPLGRVRSMQGHDFSTGWLPNQPHCTFSVSNGSIATRKGFRLDTFTTAMSRSSHELERPMATPRVQRNTGPHKRDQNLTTIMHRGIERESTDSEHAAGKYMLSVHSISA